MKFKRWLTLLMALVLSTQAARATSLPASGHISDNSRTQGELKTDLEAIVSVAKEALGGAAEYPVTLSSDAFTPPNNSGSFVITSESSTSDNLQSIAPTNVPDGHMILIRAASGHTITVKNGSSANYIATHTGSDVVLSSVKQYMILKYDGTASPHIWNVVAMNYGDQAAAARTAIGAAASGNNSDITQLSGLSTALNIGGGGTNNGSLNVGAGRVMVGDGTKITSKALGTALQILRVNSGATDVEFATGGGNIGGNGSDGNITISSNTSDTTVKQRNAAVFTVDATKTLTLKSGAVINATGAVTINGTITCASGGFIGGVGVKGDTGNGNSVTQAGGGLTPGSNSLTTTGSNSRAGGAGGANAADGGNGGNNSSTHWQTGGRAGGLALVAGSGGSGGYGDNTNTGGQGGPGGGLISIHCDGALTLASGGVISVAGGAGSNAASGDAAGGGGGAGGTVKLVSGTSVTLDTGSATTGTGGAGGNAASSNGGAGGGGGGAYVVIYSPSNTLTVAPTLTGGAAGTGSSTLAGQAGSTSTAVSLTGTPCMPMISALDRYGRIFAYTGAARDLLSHRVSAFYEYDQKQAATIVSALQFNDQKSFQTAICELVTGETYDADGKRALTLVEAEEDRRIVQLRCKQTQPDRSAASLCIELESGEQPGADTCFVGDYLEVKPCA